MKNANKPTRRKARLAIIFAVGLVGAAGEGIGIDADCGIAAWTRRYG